VGDGENLLTHLNSALKVLLGLDIFPRVPKKKLNFVDQCYQLNCPEYCSLYSDSLWVGRFEVRIPVAEEYFFFPTPVQAGTEVHTVPSSKGIGAVPLGTKATG